MKVKVLLIAGILGVFCTSCRNNQTDDTVVSRRYIHKYGYTVAKEEWDAKNYPGQVVTVLKDGATLTATYENGILHGPSTKTYPHSQTLESHVLYNQGSAAKEIYYDIQGMPVREKMQISPTRYTTTMWYRDGSPLSIEEHVNNELLEGQYFTQSNEREALVEKGNGLRIRRDQLGTLLSKDKIENGYMAKREAFYANLCPESITHYKLGIFHGEKKTFTQSGEPLLIEEWLNGQLHGKSTHFKNGTKYLEISYLDGRKHGAEIHYIDGEILSQEILWEKDKKHGPSTYYVDGLATVHWYYDGRVVSEKSYKENAHLDEMISHISEDVQTESVK